RLAFARRFRQRRRSPPGVVALDRDPLQSRPRLLHERAAVYLPARRDRDRGAEGRMTRERDFLDHRQAAVPIVGVDRRRLHERRLGESRLAREREHRDVVDLVRVEHDGEAVALEWLLREDVEEEERVNGHSSHVSGPMRYSTTAMRSRRLGKTDQMVSEVGFGAWAIGGSWGQTDDDESLAAMHAAVDAGITFFDVYGDGRSERLIAGLLRERDEDIFVATMFRWREPLVVAQYTYE